MPTYTLHLGIFYMPYSYDVGPTALLPLRRKACWGFFRPKNPTASAGCEPANLGTKGQHATSRPPKPLVLWPYDRLLDSMHQPGKHCQVSLWCKSDHSAVFHTALFSGFCFLNPSYRSLKRTPFHSCSTINSEQRFVTTIGFSLAAMKNSIKVRCLKSTSVSAPFCDQL